MSLNKVFFLELKKLIEYSVSAAIIVSSNHCVRSLSKTKIYFSYYQFKLITFCVLQKITKCLSQSKFGNEKSEQKSNPILYPEIVYSCANVFVLFTHQFFLLIIYSSISSSTKIISCFLYIFQSKLLAYVFFSHIFTVIIYF